MSNEQTLWAQHEPALQCTEFQRINDSAEGVIITLADTRTNKVFRLQFGSRFPFPDSRQKPVAADPPPLFRGAQLRNPCTPAAAASGVHN
jgi:hypothetical protein